MEIYNVENVSFRYAGEEAPVLSEISFSAESGEFITLCGKSGCGKTTLLRLLKHSAAPKGEMGGKIFFRGRAADEIDIREQAAGIGFVMQDPDNQIVADKVWHELAFGLENLGYPTHEIRARVAEAASFFGIQTWFHKKVTELSGGQKQILNLASVMAMRPEVIILDEPTSQLDPIAAREFLNMLKKINLELGCTVILSEHRLEEAVPISDRVIVMDGGRIIADAPPRKIGDFIKDNDMYCALPVQMYVYGRLENAPEYPLTLRDGKDWLEKFAREHDAADICTGSTPEDINMETAVELREVWFRYEKDMPDIVRGLNMKVSKGGIYAVVGGNGAGKSTVMSLISGINKPQRGEIFINGKPLSDIKNLHNGVIGVFLQNARALFVRKTVRLDLADTGADGAEDMAKLCGIADMLDKHPYDLSGGELQRAALAKILLKNPEILILDEPTKGMDAHFKKILAGILSGLKKSGRTVIMVSHDIEFCAECADRCAMLFDGDIISEALARDFFAGMNFYTTAAWRMAGQIIPKAMLAEDIISAFGGEKEDKADKTEEIVYFREYIGNNKNVSDTEKKADRTDCVKNKNCTEKIKKPVKLFCGAVFAVLFVITWVIFKDRYTGWRAGIVQAVSLIEAAGALVCFLPGGEYGELRRRESTGLSARGKAALFFILIAVPLTVFAGTVYFSGRKYYLTSILIILEILAPFCMAFEKRRAAAREMAVISVLCAAAAAGRAAFFMLPQFKPTAAVVIISGVCFGAETGFLVGAVSGFASGFFFAQGPWTPWQMISFGLVGFAAGMIFCRKKVGKVPLCLFGFFSVLLIYGGIMNASHVIMQQGNIHMLAAALAAGFPFDLLHAFSTAFFLWFTAEPLIGKLDRIKMKL